MRKTDLEALPGSDAGENLFSKSTDFFRLVFEDLYQPHNAISVIRTCNLLGIQNLHAICSRNVFNYDPNEVAEFKNQTAIHMKFGPGAANKCINELKTKGYKIAATTLRENSVTMDELPLDHKLALCFGTEEKGLSETVHQQADYFVYIPMFGMTQSFNVSVSAAILAYHLRMRLAEKSGPLIPPGSSA